MSAVAEGSDRVGFYHQEEHFDFHCPLPAVDGDYFLSSYCFSDWRKVMKDEK